MKTSTKNQKSGLPNRPEQLSTETKTPIDFAKRRENRLLKTDALLSLLKSTTPEFFSLAEVVGSWVWIQFPDKQPQTVTRALSEFGFHWNNKRQTWQHPCGTGLRERQSYDPRNKYGSTRAASVKAA